MSHLHDFVFSPVSHNAGVKVTLRSWTLMDFKLQGVAADGIRASYTDTQTKQTKQSTCTNQMSKSSARQSRSSKTFFFFGADVQSCVWTHPREDDHALASMAVGNSAHNGAHGPRCEREGQEEPSGAATSRSIWKRRRLREQTQRLSFQTRRRWRLRRIHGLGASGSGRDDWRKRPKGG